MEVDGETSFLLLKDVTITCKRMRHSRREFFSEMAESWKELKSSNVFSLFIVC